MNPFTEPVASVWLLVADVLLKSSLLLALTAAISALLRRASAAARHTVWTIGILSALLVPAFATTLPSWQVGVVRIVVSAPASNVLPSPPAVNREIAPPPVRTVRMDAGSAMSTSSAAPSAPAVSNPAPGGSWSAVLLAVWSAGCALVLLRLALGLAAVRWMSRRTERVTDAPWLTLARGLARQVGIRASMTFLRSDRATMPMAWGLLKPSVLMPADVESWPADRLRLVLLHELAHVKRRDCLTNVLAQVVCAAYWFNPLVWIAARELRRERERACDDLVLALGTRGSDYAEGLLQVARVMRAGRFPSLVAPATLAMAHRSQLEGRLMAILDPTLPRTGISRARTVAAAVVGVAVVLPLATVRPWAFEHVNVGAAPALEEPQLPASAAQSPSPAPSPRAAVQPAPRPAPEPAVSLAPLDTLATSAARIAVDALANPATQKLVTGAIEGAIEGAVEGAAERALRGGAQTGESRGGRPADPRTVAALTAALKDSDAEVREAAMHALVQLRDPSIFEPLVAALSDASVEIREQAVMGLAQLRDRRAIDPLRSALKDRSASVREGAVFGLGQLRDRSTAPSFVEALKDESASVREQAVFALGQLRDVQHVDALIAALSDSSASVREQAAFALGQLRDRKALQALAGAMGDSSASVREQAAFALGQLRDPSAVDTLITALRDAKPDIREQAAFGLGQIRDARAVLPLVAALKDADADVRHQAAFGLGQLRDRRAVEPLVAALRDTNADVREQAAFALGQIGDQRAVEALTEALKDAHVDVRRQAAFALGQLAR